MHPIENIMQTSMEQIKRMVDVNTVVGNPIVTAGNTMILPVSKLSLAFLVGGGEYGHMCSAKKAADEANRDSPFPVCRNKRRRYVHHAAGIYHRGTGKCSCYACRQKELDRQACGHDTSGFEVC